ncbi:MAG: hypothetical protein M3198_09620, partial [Actinomycetota bacterium]|nr:hypothetical protein [Actinomycetota bacterium]
MDADSFDGTEIAVSGLQGTVTDVNATLRGLTYILEDGSDLDVMLEAPNNGPRIQLMSDLCGDSFNARVPRFPFTTPIDLTFDDAASGPPPADSPCASGTYQPSDDDQDSNFQFTGVDVYCGPNVPPYVPGRCNPVGAPEAPASTTPLSAFNGINPNGTWRLYVVDDYPQDANCWTERGFDENAKADPNDDTPEYPAFPETCYAGQFAGGWSLDITTTGLPTVTTQPTTTTEPTT